MSVRVIVGKSGTAEVSAPGREGCRDAGGLMWSWAPSGNIEALRMGDRPVVVLGTLHGPLRDVALEPDRQPADLARAAAESDGAFAVLVGTSAGVTVVMDAAGTLPVFAGRGPRGLAVGSFAHEVAARAGLTTRDPVSVADFLLYGSVCTPFSWYEGVRLLAAGSVTVVEGAGTRSLPFWQPTEPEGVADPSCDAREWGEAMRSSVTTAVRLGTAGRRRVRVMFSGGEDSRVLASLLPRDAEVVLTTVLSGRNREYRLARSAARALGRPLELITRPGDYATAHLLERVAIAGQGMDVADVHICAEVRQRVVDADVLVGGHGADALFKTALMSNVRAVRFLPEALLAPAPDVLTGVDPAFAPSRLRPDVAAAVHQRRVEHHRRLRALRPLTAGNWHAFWPVASHSLCYGHRMAHLAVGPRALEPFLYQSVYRLAARMPDACRMERAAFRHAFAPGLGLGAWLGTTWGKRLALGPRSGAVTGRLALIARYRWDRLTGQVGRQGPWSAEPLPFAPARYLRPDELEHCRAALAEVLANGSADTFLGDTTVSIAARRRALTLAFDFADVAAAE